MTSTIARIERPATTTRARVRNRKQNPSIHVIPHVAQMHYETAVEDENGQLTWTDRGSRVMRVAVADQATADYLPYTLTAYEMVTAKDGVDYVNVAQCRLSVVVTNETGAVFTSYAIFYPHLTKN